MNRSEVRGTAKEGSDIVYFTIENSKGTKAVLSSLGAVLVSFEVKGRDGKVRDVVLGYDTPEEYYDDEPNFGCTVGRNSNRIAGAAFKLGDKEYHLDANDGTNNLHSGMNYYKFRNFQGEFLGESRVSFSLMCEALDQGFPGNLKVRVTYTLTEENGLVIEYKAVSDEDTIINMTNHSYFNLAGHDSGSEAAMDQVLELKAKGFTPMNSISIPTGEIRAVEGTPFDFCTPHSLSERIGEDDEQLKAAGGYDHNYAIDGADGEFKKVATLSDKDGNTTMEVYTDCPGIQVYSANYLGTTKGKNGATYGYRGAVCLETQYFPNAVNTPSFASPVVKAGELYRSRTEYRFV